MKTMFPRDFLLWLVKNCWHNEITDRYGIIGDDCPDMTLDEVYNAWLSLEKTAK